MTLLGKLEADVEINAPADQFHDVFSCRPHHVSNMNPNKIDSCDLHEDRSRKIVKEIIEIIHDVNLSTTFKVIEGDLLKEYKSFKLIIQATPKDEGS
uniref:Bet v I/Major latex protein domain-containing protein n=1 Tax=Manihot esculenta TaxID=3983 RepID=A0A199UBK5_MANES